AAAGRGRRCRDPRGAGAAGRGALPARARAGVLHPARAERAAHLRPVPRPPRHHLQRGRDPLLPRRDQGALMTALSPGAPPTAPGGPTSGLAPAAPSAAARTARRYAAFATRRTGQALVVVVLAYVLVFAVLAAIPGDPISAQ